MLLVAFGGVSLAAARGASAKVVWLCKPGVHPDPCTPGLSTTAYSLTLVPLRVIHPKAVRKPKIDCFYVYPTVSDQPTTNANRRIDPEERSIALYRVIAFSSFDQPPPNPSLFGRTTMPGDQVLCTNPAALRGGAAGIDPIFPSAPFARRA